LVRLHLDRPDIRVIVTGAAVQYAEYERACALPNVVADTGSLALPEVFALVGLVDVLVCPDSCLGHVSAAFGTPTVSLWCPFPARARVLGYGNHRPIEARGACSPCWCHERGELDGALRQGCPLEPAGADSGRWCKGLQAIRPQEIVEAIKEIV
jgi:ADP-heptose:LPS heptosyltransferase